jgi:hypothetical protein
MRCRGGWAASATSAASWPFSMFTRREAGRPTWYSAWRELVMLKPRPPEARRALAVEVRRQRQYVAGLDVITPSSRAMRSRRRAADALARWAQSKDYPGSAGDYERWRRAASRGAPTGNTIAAAYGSWREALLANGLDTDRSLTEGRVAAIRAGNTPSIEARRAVSRGVIVETVRRCIADLGRDPRAAEFLRWRVAHAPDSPIPMTIYRLFPGGFAEVLAATRNVGATQPEASAA